MQVTREQALAFRLSGHHLHERTDPLTAIAATGLQESPPGWATVALHARAHGEPDPADVVTVNAMRHAPFTVPATDLDVFTRALVPEDDAGLKKFVGSLPAREVAEHGLTPREGLRLTEDATRDALKDGPLGLNELHQALRERLDGTGMLAYCRGCDSHHVRSGFWRGMGPLGVTVMPAKSTWALAPEPAMPLEDARKELARRFLRAYGPATHSQLADWAGCGPKHAKLLLAAIDDEVEDVRYAGRTAFVLAEDLARLGDPPAADGVRLLGGFDPYVAQPDRDALVGGRDGNVLRKKMFPAVGRPNVVLVEGELAGLWTARKKGAALDVTVEWRTKKRVDLGPELEAVARLRGADRVQLH